MNCPTCNDEMERVDDTIVWCPRCGTLKDGDDGMYETSTPELVGINDELLAALESIVKHQDMIGGTMAVFSVTHKIAVAAIEKANLATNHTKD